jgi:hypothetical protein
MPTLPSPDLSENIAQLIFVIRGQKVMLDSHLAELYQVTTKRLNEQVQRNRSRFPIDFMFKLNASDRISLRSQFATSKRTKGGRRYAPYVFTEQGVAMLSSILKSKRAVQVNIEIMRAFVRLRRLLHSHEELSRKMTELEAKYENHDEQIRSVFEAIRRLMEPPILEKPGKIGFKLHD